MIRPEDDSFHPRTNDPSWNESAWFNFHVPERKLDGMIYCWYRPNMRYVCAGPMIWDRTGDLPWDCLWWDYNWLQTIPDDADVLNCKLPNGTVIEQLEPLHKYRLRYQGAGCEVDLVWQSIADPVELALAEEFATAGTMHYDQPGKVAGTIRLPGEGEIAVDSYSFRDRSWGPRRWGRHFRCDYLWGVASPSTWFLAGTAEDGDDDKVVYGFVMRDGKFARLVSGRRKTVERDGARPARVTLDFQDELGRRLEVEGQAQSWLACQGYPEIIYWQTLMTWRFDGVEAWGEIAETFPIQALRAAIRSGAYGPKP